MIWGSISGQKGKGPMVSSFILFFIEILINFFILGDVGKRLGECDKRVILSVDCACDQVRA
jgi:hypothetical protein